MSLTTRFTYDKWADSVYASYAVTGLGNYYDDFTWCDGLVNGHGKAFQLGKDAVLDGMRYQQLYAYSTGNEADNAVVIEYGTNHHSAWLVTSIEGAGRTEEY